MKNSPTPYDFDERCAMAQKTRQKPKKSAKHAKLQLDDIFVDCNGLSDECMAFECHFDESFKFPFEGRFVKPARGKQKLTVEKLVSSECGQMLAWVRLPDGTRLRTPVCDVEPLAPDKKLDETISLYRRWLRGAGLG